MFIIEVSLTLQKIFDGTRKNHVAQHFMHETNEIVIVTKKKKNKKGTRQPTSLEWNI